MNSFAFFCSFLPACPALNIFRPERECSALHGSYRVNLASRFVEDAVAVRFFFQTPVVADFSHISGNKIAESDSQKFRDSVHVFDLNPHVSRFAGATLAALRAFKTKAIFIPFHEFRNQTRVATRALHQCIESRIEDRVVPLR